MSKTTILYIASWPQEAPVEVFREVAAIDYDQRGEYILYYDAKDQSDNAAEQIAFGVILQDTKPPVIKTWPMTLMACHRVSLSSRAMPMLQVWTPRTARSTPAE